LQSRDENTIFSQAYAKGRKMTHTIWSIKDDSGRLCLSFEEMAQQGVSHFKTLFKENQRVSIDAIIQLALFFPRFVEEEYNKSLMEEVYMEELKEVPFSFQKYKSPSLNGWSIDFYVG
jgi:hypothetical protein